MNKDLLRRKAWGYVARLVILIYSTLYIVRPICEYLKSVTPFAALINVMMVGILGLIFWIIYKDKKIQDIWGHILLLIVFLGYGIGLWAIKYPEEKIHFIEYGVLAFLILRAISLDTRFPLNYVLSFFGCAIVGLGDELIQEVLPNRYFQWEDVILNAVSALLALLLIFGIKRKKIYGI